MSDGSSSFLSFLFPSSMEDGGGPGMGMLEENEVLL